MKPNDLGIDLDRDWDGPLLRALKATKVRVPMVETGWCAPLRCC